MQREPIRVEVTRGPIAESFHSVDAVVAGVEGPRMLWGDGFRPTLARSALKPVQALPLLTTGAAAAFELGDVELALACASHSAEADHIDAVSDWLAKVGYAEADLECGADLSLDRPTREAWLAAGGKPSPVLNCCSGKHVGFLTIARHLGLDPVGYIEPEHPIQRLVSEVVSELCQVDLAAQVPGRDGCGIPTWPLPLQNLALAMARVFSRRPAGWASTDGASEQAFLRLREALPGNIYWVSGSGRLELELADAVPEPLVAKSGAEGVFVVALPERQLAIAVKAADGADRAAGAAIRAILAELGVVDMPGDVIRTKAGVVTGTVRADAGVPDPLS